MWQKCIEVRKQSEIPSALTEYSEWKAENKLEGKKEFVFVGVSSMLQETAHAWLQPLKEALPQADFLVMSMMSTDVLEVMESGEWKEIPSMLLLNFRLVDQIDIHVRWYPLSEDLEECMRQAEAIPQDFKQFPYCKAMGLCCIGLEHTISNVLEKIKMEDEDCILFGTMAWADFSKGDGQYPFLECSFFPDEKMERGILVTYYAGEQLQVHATYALGWKTIGKALTASVKNRNTEIGDNCLCMLDDMDMQTVYKKYLGVEFNTYFTNNVGEFPLIMERDGMQIGRSSFGFNEAGEVMFFGNILEGEQVYFSYALPEEVLEETARMCQYMDSFQPEMIEILMCPVRSMILREDARKEIDFYKAVHPDVFYGYGAGEIFMRGKKGGMLNCTLVAIGMKEGQKPSVVSKPIEVKKINKKGMVPQQIRLLYFLRALTNDTQELVEKANQANAAKSTFLSHMSHEIRTPIHAVLGMDEMILRECQDTNILQYAENIDNAGKTLLSLINDVLDFSKIEEGKMEIIPVEYELHSFFNDLQMMIAERASKKGLTFHMEVDPQLPHILYGDEIRIKECLLNLLTNAVKYTDTGTVTFTCNFQKKDESHIDLEMRVKDTGKGIKAEDMDYLFVPFQRLEAKKNQHIEGTGLGMSITSRLLEMMGSALKVESTYGKGSEFSFVVEQEVRNHTPIGAFLEKKITAPCNKEAYHALFEAPEAKILIVDDMPVNLLVITNLLKHTKIQCDTARSAKAGLELLAENTYDLVLIDHMMPETDGIEMLHMIQAQEGFADQDTKYIVLTANAISGAREMYLQEGFADYLSKPVESHLLESMLQQYIPKEKQK